MRTNEIAIIIFEVKNCLPVFHVRQLTSPERSKHIELKHIGFIKTGGQFTKFV